MVRVVDVQRHTIYNNNNNNNLDNNNNNNKNNNNNINKKKATAAISWPLRVVKGRRDGDGGVITDTVTPSALAMDGPTDRLMERSTHPLIEIQGCIHKYNKQN